MVRYLSNEWIDALAEAARASEEARAAARGVRLVAEHVVTDAATYHVRVDDGEIVVRPGPATDADVRFEQDLATAVAVSSGRLSAQRAILSGRLRIGGNPTRLVEAEPVFSALDQALAPVRAMTTYEPVGG